MAIGLRSSVSLDKRQDSAATLIFPMIEEYIPETIDRALDNERPGAWKFDILNARRMLRLTLLQACGATVSFQKTLRNVWQAWTHAECVTGDMPASSSFAEARARLPIWSLEMLFKHTVALADSMTVPHEFSQFRIQAIDGTPLTLPNSPINRNHFGTTRHEHGEAYYPQALAVWVSHVDTGIVADEYLGTSREGDESIAPLMLQEVLKSGDLFLGDAHIGTFATMSVGISRGAHFVCRAQGALKVDAHITRRYASQDADAQLRRSDYMHRKYARLHLPEQLELRAVSADIPSRDFLNGTERAYFFTNLPRSEFSTSDVERLIRLRWTHETLNNDIKTRMGLGEIRSQHPEAVRREVLAHLCLHNILRLLLYRAQPESPRSLSFTAAVAALLQANEQLRADLSRRTEVHALLDTMIAQQPIDDRPGRSEPRMRRPNKRIHPMFKSSRAEWREKRKAG